MSKTPRTDSVYARSRFSTNDDVRIKLGDLARQLERENAEMAELLLSIVNNGRVSNEQLADAQALLERINK